MADPKISLDHLLGMNAIVAQLDLKYHAAKKYAAENPDSVFADSAAHLNGFRSAYWSANHTLNETAFNVALTDRPTYDAYKEATRART